VRGALIDISLNIIKASLSTVVDIINKCQMGKISKCECVYVYVHCVYLCMDIYTHICIHIIYI